MERFGKRRCGEAHLVGRGSLLMARRDLVMGVTQKSVLPGVWQTPVSTDGDNANAKCNNGGDNRNLPWRPFNRLTKYHHNCAKESGRRIEVRLQDRGDFS